MSTISASTTTTTAFKITTDTTGTLVFQTGASPTTAVTFDASGNLLVGTSSATYSAAGRGLVEINGSSTSLMALKTGGSAAGYVYHDGTDMSVVNTKAASLQLSTNGTERARIDSSGNFGLNVTPSAWGSGQRAYQVNTAALISDSGTNNTTYSSNGYYDGTNWRYIASTTATSYQQASGVHYWANAVSGTAGNVISYVQRMALNASGQLGIGTISPSVKLHLVTSTTDNVETRYQSTYAGGNFIDMGTSYNGANHYIYGYGSIPLVFATNGVERARFNAGAAILCLSGGSTSATGTGIAFPATQNASSDANTLDDYEEGTWTPTVSSGGFNSSTSIQLATYTKVGNRVTVSADFGVTGTGNSSEMRIGGLPFTVRTSGWAAGNMYCGQQNTTFRNIVGLPYGGGGGTYIVIQINNNSTGVGGTAVGSDFSAGYFNVNCTYEVA